MKVLFAIVTIFALSLTCPWSIRGSNRSRVAKISGLNGDQLGEKLNRFRARYPQAKCRRNPQTDFEDSRLSRRDWLMWVSCSMDSGVSLAGYPLLSAGKPEYPLGMTATFHNKRLVALTYVLAAQSVELLLPEVNRKYGQPSNTILDTSGIVSSASWDSTDSTLVVVKIPIEAVIDRSGFMRITERADVYAVAVRISVNDAKVPADLDMVSSVE